MKNKGDPTFVSGANVQGISVQIFTMFSFSVPLRIAFMIHQIKDRNYPNVVQNIHGESTLHTNGPSWYISLRSSKINHRFLYASLSFGPVLDNQPSITKSLVKYGTSCKRKYTVNCFISIIEAQL